MSIAAFTADVAVAMVVPAKVTAIRAATTRGPASSPTDAVLIDFDMPGSSPRPLKETLRPITAPLTTLTSNIASIRYPGMVCGFTFRGARPAGPVEIRLSGAVGDGRFDSGPLFVGWSAGAVRDTSAETSTDKASTWNFVAEAHANRGAAGWVVSVGGVPGGKKVTPSSATCSLRSLGPVFRQANGPVSYWAGFATV